MNKDNEQHTRETEEKVQAAAEYYIFSEMISAIAWIIFCVGALYILLV